MFFQQQHFAYNKDGPESLHPLLPSPSVFTTPFRSHGDFDLPSIPTAIYTCYLWCSPASAVSWIWLSGRLHSAHSANASRGTWDSDFRLFRRIRALAEEFKTFEYTGCSPRNVKIHRRWAQGGRLCFAHELRQGTPNCNFLDDYPPNVSNILHRKKSCLWILTFTKLLSNTTE
jgi:hypothetical protein